MIAERKYAMTRVGPGDWLLPSNDGHTVWRIHRHIEVADNWPDETRGRADWHVWRWAENLAYSKYVDTGDWARWEHWEGPFPTRREAVEAALR